MDKHEEKALETVDAAEREAVASDIAALFGSGKAREVLDRHVATALRDTSRDAKREVLREMMEPSEAMNWAGWREKDVRFTGDAEPMRDPANCLRAMLKQFAAEQNIDLEEVET